MAEQKNERMQQILGDNQERVNQEMKQMAHSEERNGRGMR